MVSERQLFLQHVAQTSSSPLMLEIEKAEGVFMYGTDGKEYLDLISGISVSSLGHRHPEVVEAVKNQLDKYMHLMVYGEFVQTPQVQLAGLIADLLPKNLSSTYFVNSGSEAVEGALKLAKRYTGRTEIMAFENAYHGSTHATLSLISDDNYSRNFRPLLPGIQLLVFNNTKQLEKISHKTACVIIETMQGEAGVRIPDKHFMKALREKCTETGALLIFDEVQTGFGRTGRMFAFEHFGVVPDIICFAKGMGGGMPIGAFTSSTEIMQVFQNNPVLGHITTFGGHPVCCAAALATISHIHNNRVFKHAKMLGELFRNEIQHPVIKEVRGEGLFIALELGDTDKVHKIINLAIENGMVTDWFLFCETAVRIAPPLIISEEQLLLAARKLKNIFGRL